MQLEIVATDRGGPFDEEGTVEFRAHHERDGVPGVLHEVSRFTRVDRRWVYLDAAESDPIVAALRELAEQVVVVRRGCVIVIRQYAGCVMLLVTAGCRRCGSCGSPCAGR